MAYSPFVLSDDNGAITIRIVDSGGMSPEMIIAGLSTVLANKGGVPTPEGIVPGWGFITAGSNPNSPVFFAIVNKGMGVNPDSRSVLLRIYGFQAQNQGANPGVETLLASGSFDAPAAVKAGDRLGKYVGMGHNGVGYGPNENGSFSIWADQDFSNVSGDIKSGGSCAISTVKRDTNVEVFRAYWDSDGNMAVGNWFPYGRNFPGKRMLIIQEAEQAPTASVAGAGCLYVEAGALKYRGPNGTVTTLAPA